VDISVRDAGASGRALRDDKWPPESERILLRYQRRWYLDRSPFKVAAKSRQVGITWTTALEAVEVAALRRSEGGMDVYFMTTSKEDARQFILDCAGWIRDLTPIYYGLIDELEIQQSEDWFEDDDGGSILAFRIDFPSGHTIYALPSRPARMRGKQGYAILDEAAHQDLEAWITAAGGLLMWGGRLAIISTYFGVDNAFYKLVDSVKTGEQRATLHEIDIYDALADGLYKRICRSRGLGRWSQEAEQGWLDWLRGFYGPHRFAQECECIPGRGGGQLYPRAAIMKCMTAGPEECDVIEIVGGQNPRIWTGRGREMVGHSPEPWEGEDAIDLDVRLATLKAWLDQYLEPVLDKLARERLPVYVGGDLGRKLNPSSWVVGQLARDMRRSIRLILELENVGWTEQDFVLDFMWNSLGSRLVGGCSDGMGSGEPTAERAARRTGGRVRAVRIKSGWHEPQFSLLGKRLSEGSLLLPQYAPLLGDLASIRRVNGKIVVPQRTTEDERQQKRHGELGVALALFEQSIGMDGPGTLADKKAKPRRVVRRRPQRGRRR
jgi:phage FluMu gp28-like protein